MAADGLEFTGFIYKMLRRNHPTFTNVCMCDKENKPRHKNCEKKKSFSGMKCIHHRWS